MIQETSMVTTKDNPYDYFEDFDNWFQFDITKGYNTLGLIARIASTYNETLSDDVKFDYAVYDVIHLFGDELYTLVHHKEDEVHVPKHYANK